MKLLKIYEFADTEYKQFLKSKFNLMDIEYKRNAYNEIYQLRLRLKSNINHDKYYLLPLIEEFGEYYWKLKYELNSTFFIIELSEEKIYDFYRKYDSEINANRYNL